jgi:L,D-peptidoglycan transpeptidase YkuD (ErfK/YbiS/YcfS/YnhG family)
MGPDRSGDQPGEVPRAAATFLHRFSYDANGNSKPTSGCVSLAGDDLDAVLRALVPGEAWFVITA